MGNFLGNIVEWTLNFIMALPLIYGAGLHVALIFVLIYKRNYVLNFIDQELEKIKITSKFKNLSQADSKINYFQHAFFIFTLTGLIYWYTTLEWWWLKDIFLLTALSTWAIWWFWIAFTNSYSNKYIIITKYLNARWTTGVFFASSILTLIQILIDIVVWIKNTWLFKTLYKLITYALVVFITVLVFTTANINRDNFSEFCRNIYPPIANAIQDIYIGFDGENNH
jgi:hypothetical protein